ncbi:carbohydrate binding family 9 domain-containing protein [Aquimarina sp. TRL1]|uniref:carbohydrate binding family 9 domain-containing protein n=1 Tax=Aquimarina sp. (strain TRL1) TaxID=2736252 RepID=UPI00158C309C|nr:carbohydrate binding family 9 domain-containing protein [Aquimarina sp. TRL1]QKX06645.1 carbohydrate binding family 9 domain-containing protein [Aquimarina sp. TRL1]
MKTKIYISLLLGNFYFCGISQQKAIPFIEQAAKIDGALNESVWKQAALFTEFNNYYPNDEGKADHITTVRGYHDRKNLYIGVEYYDTNAYNKISTLKRDNHGDAVVSSDAFGIILDPFNTENNGYYFTLNAANTQVDALIEFNGTDYSFNESWNAVWKSETAVEGTKKIYEIEIPFKALNFDVDNTTWGIQFFYRDFKTNQWMTYTDMPRNFFQFDLRFTADVLMEQLPKATISRFMFVPSGTYSYQKDITTHTDKSNFKPSLDAQYNLTSSLRLDATINPDFSQIDVDQQVVNLTRFAINFPERRNFFLENSDLFNNLGTFDVNPFYSRRIGGTTDMQFGVKLSGNITPDTRIGILNAQTEKSTDHEAQNYAVFVARKKLSRDFTTTAYWVNRQQTDRFDILNTYNRVLGVNLNYRSKNKLWSAQTNYGKSFSSNIHNKNDFFNIEGQYNTRETYAKAALKTVDKNFITDVGFTPRLYNYDAIKGEVIRDAYVDSYFVFQKNYYPVTSEIIDRYRYLSVSNDAFWDHEGTLTEMTTVIGNSVWFKKNLSSLYLNVSHGYFNLTYGFDILNNGNPILPGVYNTLDIKTGYNNRFSNQNFYYEAALFYGGYFNGKRRGMETTLGYRLLPFAQFNINYSLNHIDLEALGNAVFHLVRFTGEVFLNNRINWTTYVQYNTQLNSFNINSRLQWEYRPLSYLYLVATDNFNKQIARTNWGVAIKANYRFDL